VSQYSAIQKGFNALGVQKLTFHKLFENKELKRHRTNMIAGFLAIC
jgi:hypothetical protein